MGCAVTWWWPFGRKEPLERWLDSYDRWLGDFGKLMRRFPDHTGLEGERLSGSEEHLLEQISDLYGVEARQLLEMMTLRSMQLRQKHRQLGDGR